MAGDSYARDPYYTITEGHPYVLAKHQVDPEQFLELLKDNFKDISKGHSSIKLPDLELYAQNGKDPKVREVASLAAKNFDEFSGLAHGGKKRNTVNMDDLKKDINLISPDIDAMIRAKEFASGAEMVGMGVASVLGFTASLFCLEAPPAAYGVAALSAAAGIDAGRAATELINAREIVLNKPNTADEKVWNWIADKGK